MARNSNGTAEEPTSRRAVLVAAVGAAAATPAAAVLPAEHVRAANGDPLILGQPNAASAATDLDGPLVVRRSGGSTDNPPDVAIEATSVYGTGVVGHTTSGQWGSVSAGVRGIADDPHGVAVAAVGDVLGYGLTVRGKVGLQSRSGRAYVAAGKSYVDVDLRSKGSLPGLPLCFAILNSYRPGVFVTSLRADTPSGGMLRIYLNRAVDSRTAVAWFVLN